MPERKSKVIRETKETRIVAELVIDGSGQVDVKTGVGFFDHMLSSAMVHGFFDLKLDAAGDLHVDDHHTVEDAGIVLGKAFSDALGDFKGIKRFGSAFVPMDEALAHAAVDISRRPFLAFNSPMTSEKIGTFDSQLIEEFWRAFANNCGVNLHIDVHRGQNMHHIAEAVFKAAGRALDEATQPEPRAKGAVSTKGSL